MYELLLQSAAALYLLAIFASFGRVVFPAANGEEEGSAMQTASFALAWLGLLSHAGAVVGAGLAAGRLPFDLAEEKLSLVALAWTAVYLGLRLARRAAWMSMFLLPPSMALMFAFSNADSTIIVGHPVRGPFFYLHMGLVIISVLLLLMHGVMSFLYIAQESRLKAKRVPLTGSPLPPLDVCDRVGLRALMGGFASLTLAILTGAISAVQMRGSFFAWKFPEVFALLTWFIFGLLLEARLARGWRGKQPALLSLVGFIILLAVWVGVTVI